MTRIIIAFILALIPMASVAADKQKAPQISFVTKSHDFGTIRENAGPVSVEFSFTNTGDAPLVIISATASCGCTRPNYPQAPVKPGKSAKIKVTIR